MESEDKKSGDAAVGNEKDNKQTNNPISHHSIIITRNETNTNTQNNHHNNEQEEGNNIQCSTTSASNSTTGIQNTNNDVEEDVKNIFTCSKMYSSSTLVFSDSPSKNKTITTAHSHPSNITISPTNTNDKENDNDKEKANEEEKVSLLSPKHQQLQYKATHDMNKLSFLWRDSEIIHNNEIFTQPPKMREIDREFQVYGFFQSTRTPRVKFAPEIIREAKEKGDVAGKDRQVQRAKKRRKTLKKVMDSQGRIICDPDVFDDADPDLDFPDECPVCCKCLQKRESDDLNINTPSKISLNYRIQAENFSTSLDQAGGFIEGNMKTINVARDVFSLPPFKDNDPLTDTQVNGLGAKLWLFTYGLKTLFYHKSESDIGKLKSRSLQRIADVAALTQAALDFHPNMSDISIVNGAAAAGESSNSNNETGQEQPEQQPKSPESEQHRNQKRNSRTKRRVHESQFKKLVSQFQQLGQECEKLAVATSSFYTDYLDFEAKITYLLSKVLARLRVSFDTRIERIEHATKSISRRKLLPLKKCKGNIDINKPIILAKEIDIEHNEPGALPIQREFDRLRNFPVEFRFQALSSLISDVLHSVTVINAQIRFLHEDLSSGKFEEDDVQILNIIIFMDGCIKFFLKSEETSKYHEQNLKQVMRTFCRDTYELLRSIQTTVRKVIELRDTFQLCFTYLNNEFQPCSKSDKSNAFALNLQEYKPSTIFEFHYLLKFCFVRESKVSFKPEDFHCTPFSRILQLFQVTCGKTMFVLQSRMNESEAEIDFMDNCDLRFSDTEDEDPAPNTQDHPRSSFSQVQFKDKALFVPSDSTFSAASSSLADTTE